MLLQDVINKTKTLKTDTVSWNNALLQVLRENHYWPAIQTKRFHNKNNLILLHNTYKRKDVNQFKELYNECRSVILDFSTPEVILHKASPIPETITYDEIKNNKLTECTIAYDVTTVYVYYTSEWMFSTSTCTNIDHSKFNHPIKNYGVMFDEILPFSREEFKNKLNPSYVYTFGILHYDNKKYIDYTSEFGENYKKLILMGVKEKFTLKTVDTTIPELADITIIPQKLQLQDALQLPDIYGIIFKDNNTIYRASSHQILFKEETDFGYFNVWRNMIWIYQKNLDDFHISDYLSTYNKTIEYPTDNNGEQLDPTYLIHTTMITIRDILFNLYTTTTVYYKNYNRFKMSKDIDSKLPPILQYHLAQLRRQQVSIYIEDTITNREVFHYLCYSNPIKNIIALINFFATNSGYDITPRASLCFTILNNLLI